MKSTETLSHASPVVHAWLQKIAVAYVPGPTTPLLDQVVDGILHHFREGGHWIKEEPDNQTDVILTTATFGKPVRWRNALLFTGRRRFNLDHSPIIVTLLQITSRELHDKLAYFESILLKDPPDPEDFAFDGMAPEAYQTLYEQGRRGGPILALVRLVQTQAMSIRNILVVGDDTPLKAYTFDLVGAHPCTDASDREFFYEDLMNRITTAASTREVTNHQVIGDPIPSEVWTELESPRAMREAGRELGARAFFTEMVKVANLAHVPAIHDAISSQYSEGCYATWEPEIDGLIATVTGNARPIEKDNLTDDELSVIVGVRADGLGALVRHVEGKRNDSPSSEAVELMDMDSALPKVALGEGWDWDVEVPVARSKLHGHRGIRSYDPEKVEHVPLDKPYYHYPVSCSTEAQARAIKAAFSRSESLNNPDDPRQVVFTVLPGHGIVIVEKWVAGKKPFEVMCEYMDKDYLVVDNFVPQGPLSYLPSSGGRMVLETLEG
jgi:hypothetical protein